MVGFVIWIYRQILSVLVFLHTKCYLLFICWQKTHYNLYDAWHQTLLSPWMTIAMPCFSHLELLET